jgi:hypothetical protein
LILVVPHREGTFDHRRPLTTIEHLLDDLENGVDEGDDTHVGEVLELHDLTRDSLHNDFAEFKARILEWRTMRGLHHHVFDTHLAAEMAGRAGFRVMRAERAGPADILIVAVKE